MHVQVTSSRGPQRIPPPPPSRAICVFRGNLPVEIPRDQRRYCNRRSAQINVTRAQLRRNLNFADNLLLR